MNVRQNINAFKEVDTAVVLRLNQPDLMEMVQQDKILAKVCQPVSEGEIMVRTSNMTRVRKRLKTLGYLLT